MNDSPKPSKAGSILGSLRDALAAAGRDDRGSEVQRDLHAQRQRAEQAKPQPPASAQPPASVGSDDSVRTQVARAVLTPDQKDASKATSPDPVAASSPPPVPAPDKPEANADSAATKETKQAAAAPVRQSAADAARQARGERSPMAKESNAEATSATTRMVAGAKTPQAAVAGAADASASTQLVRGKAKVARKSFHQDPVVGWLVVIGGPGLGAYRPVFEGNNTLGRAASQRIPVDFGDDAISSEEQAYIRYDSMDRTFLFVPNLSKTNVVQVNHEKPTAAVPLSAMDVITVGRTQLVFVPFCGPEFDWAELASIKE